jgi:hypothetical protein
MTRSAQDLQPRSGPAEVLVDGWVNRTGDARLNFVKNMSNHCLLCAEIA